MPSFRERIFPQLTEQTLAVAKPITPRMRESLAQLEKYIISDFPNALSEQEPERIESIIQFIKSNQERLDRPQDNVLIQGVRNGNLCTLTISEWRGKSSRDGTKTIELPRIKEIWMINSATMTALNIEKWIKDNVKASAYRKTHILHSQAVHGGPILKRLEFCLPSYKSYPESAFLDDFAPYALFHEAGHLLQSFIDHYRSSFRYLLLGGRAYSKQRLMAEYERSADAFALLSLRRVCQLLNIPTNEVYSTPQRRRYLQNQLESYQTALESQSSNLTLSPEARKQLRKLKSSLSASKQVLT